MNSGTNLLRSKWIALKIAALPSTPPIVPQLLRSAW
jgi:hypothetical protein